MYPRAEQMAAYAAARTAGVDVPHPDTDYAAAVRILEAGGWLPRDPDRVARLVAEATTAARRDQAQRAEAHLTVAHLMSAQARRVRLDRVHRMRRRRSIVIRTF